MPQKCSVCTHSERPAIDAALVRNDSNRRIAAQYALTEASLRRHKRGHLPRSLVRSQHAQEVAQADSLLADVRQARERSERLYRHAETILERALEVKDLRTALHAIGASLGIMREARGYLELRGSITGELKTAKVEVNAPGGKFLLMPFGPDALKALPEPEGTTSGDAEPE